MSRPGARPVPPRAALAAAIFFALVALCATLVLALAPGAGAAALLALAIVLGWSYSAPPLRLEWRGLGELTIAAVVPGLVPVTALVLQAGEPRWASLAALAPLMALQVAVALAINTLLMGTAGLEGEAFLLR